MLTKKNKTGLLLMLFGFLCSVLVLGTTNFVHVGLKSFGSVLCALSSVCLLEIRSTLKPRNDSTRRKKMIGFSLSFLGILCMWFQWPKLGVGLKLVGMVDIIGSFGTQGITFLHHLFQKANTDVMDFAKTCFSISKPQQEQVQVMDV